MLLFFFFPGGLMMREWEYTHRMTFVCGVRVCVPVREREREEREKEETTTAAVCVLNVRKEGKET